MSKISKKDIKNMIIAEKNNIIVPDLKAKIHESIKKNHVLMAKTDIKESNKKGIGSFKFKFASIAITFATIILIVVIFVGGGTKSGGNPPISITKQKQAYVMQATSLFNYANDSVFSANGQVVSLISIQNISNNVDYNNIALQISENLEAVEEIFNKESTKYELIKLENNEYQYKLEATISLGSNTKSYIMYYNETILYEKDWDKDIDEVSSKLEGYIESNDIKYYFMGVKELEKDETEIEFTLYLNEEKSNFIIVSQEVESRENEYSYKFFENKKLVKEIEIEKETRNKIEIIELTIEDRKTNLEEEYEFIKKNNTIIVSFEENELEIEATITVSNENYEFNFGKNNIVIIDKKALKQKNSKTNSQVYDL